MRKRGRGRDREQLVAGWVRGSLRCRSCWFDSDPACTCVSFRAAETRTLSTRPASTWGLLEALHLLLSFRALTRSRHQQMRYFIYCHPLEWPIQKLLIFSAKTKIYQKSSKLCKDTIQVLKIIKCIFSFLIKLKDDLYEFFFLNYTIQTLMFTTYVLSLYEDTYANPTLKV